MSQIYGINVLKINAIKEYCQNNNYRFLLITENELKDLSTTELVSQRMDKYCKMGEFKE